MNTEPVCHFGWVSAAAGIAALGCGWFIDSFWLALGCSEAIAVAAILVEVHWAVRKSMEQP